MKIIAQNREDFEKCKGYTHMYFIVMCLSDMSLY